jgi:hypothetical protein
MVNQPVSQQQETVIDTRYWHVRPDGRVQCGVCPRACRMHEGQRGLVGLSPAQPDCLEPVFRTRWFAVTVSVDALRRRRRSLVAARRPRTLHAAPLPARGSAARSETARQT